ncbi:MAG TPA: AraC family transcriptional regulator [Candidatus Udaeobacter sp.]|nr:AraC family transcriptional regulator [Candidatus Udaeobacter sp.]
MPAAFDIHIFGMNTPHDPEFVIERPFGCDNYLLMCFSTPFFTQTIHGIELGQQGDCILHDPGFPQYHGTPEGMSDGFRNDWIHFTGDDVPGLAKRYDVPFNQIISTGEPHLLGPYLRSIETELSLRKPYWKQKTSLVLEEILLLLSRHKQMHDEFDKLTAAEQEFKYKFMTARTFIHEHYEQDWTVNKMSELVNLSAERFGVLYQKYFHMSPKDDLISKRLEEAKIQLLNSHHSIEQIALRSGFNSLYYFSRLFKKRVGRTPSDYRKSLGG